VTTGIVVMLVAVFLLGASSALFTGVFLVLIDKQVRREIGEKSLGEQIRLILN
jgi:hypothetical protein